MNPADDRVIIRRARPEDNPAVLSFVSISLREFGIEPDLEGKDADIVGFGRHGEDVDEFVAEVDGTAIGSVMVAPHREGSGWLSKFFVDERHRGKGIGRALLARAVDAARRRGYRSLALDTRWMMKEAIHLYESTGWTLDPAGPEDGPCEALYTLEL